MMNLEDLTAKIDAAMAAMEMVHSESDLDPLSEPNEDHTTPIYSTIATTIDIPDTPAPNSESVNDSEPPIEFQQPLSTGCGHRGRDQAANQSGK